MDELKSVPGEGSVPLSIQFPQNSYAWQAPVIVSPSPVSLSSGMAPSRLKPLFTARLAFATSYANVLSNTVPEKKNSSVSFDLLDGIVLGGYGASLAGGIALIAQGPENKPLSSFGYGMIVMAGEGLLMELLERLTGGDHHRYRGVRLAASVGTGILMGVAWQFLYGSLQNGGLGGGNSGRNPVRPFGP